MQEFIRKLDHMLEKKSGTACPTCNRAFEEEAEARDLRTDLRDMVNKIPNRVKTIKEKIARFDRNCHPIRHKGFFFYIYI